MTISLAPRSLTAFLMKVAATGWFTVGLAPMTMITSASSAAENGAVTAPEFRPSISAATDEAWHRRVQWSTLFEPKPSAHQLLEEVGLLVRALGRAEARERARARACRGSA